MDHYVDESECAADLDSILQWICLMACHARRNAAGVEKHRNTLKANGETDGRLQEFARWRESTAFTEREKAALSLSESMSLRRFKALSQTVLKDAKDHFNREEMIRLTLNILTVNDWINHHSGFQAHILVVEDEPLDRELLRVQLQRAQIEDNVLFVPDARQAITVLEDYQSGERDGELIALFLDLRLPGMSGIELLRHIRALSHDMKDIPVIVMTASNDPYDVEECRRLKVASYVEKPITLGSFSRAVANMFHQANGKGDPTFVR